MLTVLLQGYSDGTSMELQYGAYMVKDGVTTVRFSRSVNIICDRTQQVVKQATASAEKTFAVAASGDYTVRSNAPLQTRGG